MNRSQYQEGPRPRCEAEGISSTTIHTVPVRVRVPIFPRSIAPPFIRRPNSPNDGRSTQDISSGPWATKVKFVDEGLGRCE